jgi:periplasmic protein TonB
MSFLFRTNTWLSLFAFFSCYSSLLAQDTSTIFLDQTWKETDKKSAVYYRKRYEKNNEWYVCDFYMSGQLQMRGKYKDYTLKVPVDSFFFYHRNGQLKTLGNHENGKRAGKWLGWFDDGTKNFSCTYKENSVKYVYYHQNGVVSAVEEYVNDSELVSAKLFDSTGAISENKYLEIPPTLNGKEDGYYEFFGKTLQFPSDENGNRLYGTVKFYIIIDKTGKAKWGDIIGFAHPETALSLERAVQKMPLWSPAKYHNRIVEYALQLSFNFRED